MNGVPQQRLRPGMALLLEVLRGGMLPGNVGAEEWAAMLALAAAEHVLPWTAHCALLRADVPAEMSARLAEIEREAALSAFVWAAELRMLLREFHIAGIPVTPLKGPFLALRLYGDMAWRSCRDLDLLVAREDVRRAESLLERMGFVKAPEDDYHRQWQRESCVVELHHDVENPLAFDFRTAEALGRATEAEFLGEPCLQLTVEDELSYLALHAVRHAFDRLSLLVDLHLACVSASRDAAAVRTNPAGQSQSVAPDARSPLRLALAVTARLYPGGKEAAPSYLDALAAEIWGRMLTQPQEPLDWAATHRFYLRLEAPGAARLRRRMRHLRILLTRVIDRDYAFAARLGLRRPWQAWLLRPLRLLAGRLGRG